MDVAVYDIERDRIMEKYERVIEDSKCMVPRELYKSMYAEDIATDICKHVIKDILGYNESTMIDITDEQLKRYKLDSIISKLFHGSKYIMFNRLLNYNLNLWEFSILQKNIGLLELQ